MHNDGSIPYRLSVFISHHNEINQRQGLVLFLGCYRQGKAEGEKRNNANTDGFHEFPVGHVF
jgi:hypothetical protein